MAPPPRRTGPEAGPIAGLASIVADNGLVLPVFVLLLSMTMLLPLHGRHVGGRRDRRARRPPAGCATCCSRRSSRARLLAVKAFGVATMSLLAVTVMAVVGVIAGMAILGGDGMLTLSGTTLPFGEALGRVALLVVLVTSRCGRWPRSRWRSRRAPTTRWWCWPLTLGGIIMFTVLTAISSLDWLHPVLITDGWHGARRRRPRPDADRRDHRGRCCARRATS